MSNCKTPHKHVIHFISNDTHLDIKTTNQNILLPLSSSPRVTPQLLQMSKMNLLLTACKKIDSDVEDQGRGESEEE